MHYGNIELMKLPMLLSGALRRTCFCGASLLRRNSLASSAPTVLLGVFDDPAEGNKSAEYIDKLVLL